MTVEEKIRELFDEIVETSPTPIRVREIIALLISLSTRPKIEEL